MRSVHLVVLSIVALTARAHAFDTWWHDAATSAAAKNLGFSGDAINVLQVGNFSVDFYSAPYDGPVAETVSPPTLAAWAESAKWRTGIVATMQRRAFTFLHFDNLQGSLTTNRDFATLWNRFKGNAIRAINRCKDLDFTAVGKKLCVLLTLGASFHTVEDFYSHTDWTHQDFTGIAKTVTTPWDGDRTPTWFEVAASFASPDAIPFKVRAGLYPPPAGDLPNSHDNIAHDNSDLRMSGEMRAAMHNYGPYPARDGALAHVQYAVRAACAADVQWAQMLAAEDEGVREALASAVKLDLARESKILLRHLDGATWMSMFFPCMADHLDGTTQKAKGLCKGIFKVPIASKAAGAIAAVGYEIWTNKYWDMIATLRIIDWLGKDLGIVDGQGVRYNLP